MKNLTSLFTLVLMFLMTTSGYAWINSVYDGTYVDASLSNTQAVDGSGPGASTDLNTAITQKIWYIRGFQNEGSIYAADSKTGAIDAPLLVTQIADLKPWFPYNAYVIIWSANNDNWDIWAGFNPDTLSEYSRTANTTSTGADTDGNRDEYAGFLGTGFATGDGVLKVYVDDDNDGPRSWYDGIVYKIAFMPFKPQPADNTLNIALDAAVSFEPMRDPNNLNNADPRIIEHQIRINTNPNLTSDPNFVIPASQPTSFNPSLEANAAYYWRVDEKLNDGTIIKGIVWSFNTIKTVPDFDPPLGMQPEDVGAKVDQTASFMAVAGTTGGLGGTMQYQWYAGLPNDEIADVALTDQTGHISGAQSSELSIVTQIDDAGSYYCVATNEIGSATSNAANLRVKRTLAHWTLDLADYQDGQYKDISGVGHHADPNGVPTFIEGVNGTPDGAVQFGNHKAWANAGNWDPMENSGEFSVSCWAKLTGSTGTIQSLISKRDGWSAQAASWSLRRNDDGRLRITTFNPGTVDVIEGLVANKWQYVVATFDGSVGKLYINGELAAQNNISISNQASAATIWLGDLQGDEAFLFSGALDDIQITNYAKDSYEIAKDYVNIVTDASICVELPDNDFNEDCIVNLEDFAMFAIHWLECGKVPLSSCE